MRAPSPDASERVDPSAKLRAGSLPVGEAGARNIVACDDPTKNFARDDARLLSLNLLMWGGFAVGYWRSRICERNFYIV
jgi:hypothetical protein